MCLELAFEKFADRTMCLLNTWSFDARSLFYSNQNTHGWSAPLYSFQLLGTQNALANSPSVRWEHFIDVANIFDLTVLFHLLEVLVEELLRVGNGSNAIFLLPCIYDTHTHTRCRHRCGILSMPVK